MASGDRRRGGDRAREELCYGRDDEGSQARIVFPVPPELRRALHEGERAHREDRGRPDNPHNEGYVCARLEQDRWKDFEYNPNRLKRPLKRAGERGEGKWEEISWDQAFDEMAQRLAELRDEYGAETLCFLEGTYRTQSNLHYKFTNLFGSPNTGGNGTICYSSDMWLEPCTYGGFCSDKSDWKRADLVVLWGRNPRRVRASELAVDAQEHEGARREAHRHRSALL